MFSAEAPELAALHLHQRVSGLDARERLAERVATAAAPDLFVLLTCHRVEAYSAASGEDARAHFSARLGDIGEADVLSGVAAARHLFRAAAGLDSAIRGEGQILGQLRRAYDAARAAGPLHPLLSEAIQRALHVAREIRAATALGAVRGSVGSVAVDEVVRLISEPARATVLVVGAGEIGKLAARALAQRVGAVVIANRDAARAAAVAADAGASSVALEDLGSALAAADAVISAADTRGSLLTVELLSPRLRRGPLVVVDIAVPRSVAEPARGLPGLVYRSVDDLAADSEASLGPSLEEAERRCAAEAEEFVASRRQRAAAATIRALRERAERVRRERLDRALAKLAHLPERDRRVVASLASGLTGALLHEPTLALRRDPARAGDARALFGLGEGEA